MATERIESLAVPPAVLAVLTPHMAAALEEVWLDAPLVTAGVDSLALRIHAASERGGAASMESAPGLGR